VEAALRQNKKLVSDLGPDHILRLYKLDVISCVDRALVILREMGKQYFGQRRYDLIVLCAPAVDVAAMNAKKPGKNSAPPTALAHFYYLLGLAELGLDHPIKAGKAFANAYKIMSSEHIKRGHEAAKAWKGLKSHKRLTRRDVFFADLPKSPIVLSRMNSIGSPAVASEHWVMRELGFEGTIPYAYIIKSNHAVIMTNKPHPSKSTPGPRTASVRAVKPQALAKHVVQYRNQLTLLTPRANSFAGSVSELMKSARAASGTMSK
jgi:hypothetical protein